MYSFIFFSWRPVLFLLVFVRVFTVLALGFSHNTAQQRRQTLPFSVFDVQLPSATTVSQCSYISFGVEVCD
jgi:hypothetical protein